MLFKKIGLRMGQITDKMEGHKKRALQGGYGNRHGSVGEQWKRLPTPPG